MVIRPASIGSNRLIIDSNVDLPAPFGPISEVIPPRGMVKVTLSTTLVPRTTW